MGGKTFDQFTSRQQARNKKMMHTKDPESKNQADEQDKTKAREIQSLPS
ncbi:hypothetical protein [Sporomusa sp. KB1]|jgi:hypothetical protein|nr:hypothetical protein [Sporomusa sp. KB1]TWH47313.1 hypothetical protein Salpa_3363 [Sporomusa sp. KB1]